MCHVTVFTKTKTQVIHSLKIDRSAIIIIIILHSTFYLVVVDYRVCILIWALIATFRLHADILFKQLAMTYSLGPIVSSAKVSLSTILQIRYSWRKILISHFPNSIKNANIDIMMQKSK